MRWTTSNMPSQVGKTAIVTGANSGIGLETAKALAGKGAQVVLACRSLERGEQAVREIARALAGEGPARAGGAPCCCAKDAPLEIISGGSATVMALDLADLASVRAFAAAFLERFPRLDLLINNAGVMIPPRAWTVDGFEMQMGVNHLGHFALTGLLLPRLLEAAAPRVVVVSSVAHRFGRMDFTDLHWRTRPYRKWQAYSDSKLANLYFAGELQRRFGKDGTGLKVVAAHPGWTATRLQKHVCLGRMFNGLFAMRPWQGALPSLYAATAAALQGGEYVGPNGCLGLRGYPGLGLPSCRAGDQDTARKLWDVSAALTGVGYESH